MWRATWRGLVAHKLRLSLTTLAVILGVGFVSGTLVLTDTLSQVFDDLFTDAFAGIDVIVRASGPESPDNDFGRTTTMPQEVLTRVQSVSGVAAAEGSVDGDVTYFGADGEPVTRRGPPIFATSWGTVDELTPLELRSGRAPSGPDEVIVDAGTARKQGFDVGETVRIAPAGGGQTQTFRIVGITGFGRADNLGGATLFAFELSTAQRLFDKLGRLDSIGAMAGPDVDAHQLRDRIDAALPETTEVITASTAVSEAQEDVREGLGFFTTGLLAFAGVALFVGQFLIFNTFSIVIAQRTRELALLRALGASRSQVRRSVIAEAAVVGVVASVVGIAFGILVAAGLRSLFEAFGGALPEAGNVIQARTVVVGLLTGTIATLTAATLPARRAARLSPVVALRDVEAGVDESSASRVPLGAAALVLGGGLAILGLRGTGPGAWLVAAGALAVFLGMAAMAPGVVRPVCGFIGWPAARWFRLPGRLGRENAARQPRRTASTAAALMIGLALVTFVSVFAETFKASARAVLDETLRADLVVSSEGGNISPTFSPDVASELSRVPQLDHVVSVRSATFRRTGDEFDQVAGVDPAAIGSVLHVEGEGRPVADLEPDEVLVRQPEADDRNLSIGDTIRMGFAGTARAFKVAGTYERRGLLRADYVVRQDVLDSLVEQPQDVSVLMTAAPGVGQSAARAAVAGVLNSYPGLSAQDQAQLKEEAGEGLDRLFGLVTALLGLAIVIALLGITNTLALSIVERTRELGLLRAVGMGRRQVRSMVRWEAVLVATLGAVLGLPVGVAFAAALVGTLNAAGNLALSVPVVPVGRLAIFVVLAAAAGVAAAVFPARRAARLDVLRAIATE